MAVSVQIQTQTILWDSVVELTKVAQEKGGDPLVWAIQVSSSLNSAGVSLPSTEVAHLLVSYICWENNVSITWKFLEKALEVKIVPPMLVLALLSLRVIPSRHSRPAAYRVYMELLKRHASSFSSQINGQNFQKILKSVDDVLHLSQIFGLQAYEPGVLAVEFVFSVVWQLLDASLDDERLLELTAEKEPRWATRPQDMVMDVHDSLDRKRTEHCERLHKTNMVMAIELIGQFLQNEVTSKLLYLARQNMPSHWGDFIQRLRLLAENSSALRNSKILSPEVLLQLISDKRKLLSRKCKISSQQEFHAVLASGSLTSCAGQCYGASWSLLWLPIDLILEDAMDGYKVTATSAIDTLSGLVKSLQAVNGNTWHDAFLGLWISALRLVQRERDPIEGPVPRTDTRLCILLCIITLVVVDLIEEEELALIGEAECSATTATNEWKEKQVGGKRRKDLVSSLQILGDFQGLLAPPQSVISVANQAAAKAMMFVSGLTVGSGYFECINMNDMPMNCSGNLRHLIVEACIARNLLDTSAYFWPGYVNGRINQIPHGMPGQVPGWSSLLKGAPLTPSMINALVAAPASRG